MNIKYRILCGTKHNTDRANNECDKKQYFHSLDYVLYASDSKRILFPKSFRCFPGCFYCVVLALFIITEFFIFLFLSHTIFVDVKMPREKQD